MSEVYINNENLLKGHNVLYIFDIYGLDFPCNVHNFSIFWRNIYI